MKPNQAMLCSAQRSSHTEDVLFTHFRPALKQFCWLCCCLVYDLCLVVGFSSSSSSCCCCCCSSNFHLPPGARSHVLGGMGTFGLRVACITTGQSRASEQGKNQGAQRTGATVHGGNPAFTVKSHYL